MSPKPASPESANPETVNTTGLLDRAEVLICMGAGGVGKTTTAAALGIAAAEAGRKVVVLTVDPARRLADALGIAGDDDHSHALGQSPVLGNQPCRIEGDWSGELWAVMLDPAATFDDLVRDEAADAAQAEAVMSNRLYQNLTTTLSGTHEYMAAERLRSLHLDARFDLVVLDTPPSRHAIDLLDSPGRLSRFVDHRLYRSVLAPKRGVMRLVGNATQFAFKVISRVVGAAMVGDVIEFFAAFEGMDQGFRDRAAEVDELLRAPTTAYVVISAARTTAIAETIWLWQRLETRGLSCDALVVNRLTPSFGPPPKSGDLTDPLDQNLAEMQSLANSERKLIDELVDHLTKANPDYGLSVAEVEEQMEPVCDIEGLTRLARIMGDLPA